MIDGILAIGYAQQLFDSVTSGLDHAEDVGDNTIRFYWTNNTTTDVVLNPSDKVNETVTQVYPYVHATTKEATDSFSLYIPSSGTWKLQLLGNCQVQDIDNTYKLSYQIEGEEEVVISEGTMIEHADDPTYWRTTGDIEYSINLPHTKVGKKIEVKFEWTNKKTSNNYLQFIAITEHTADLKSVPDYLRYNRYLIKNCLEF